jgi:hypothetical protein
MIVQDSATLGDNAVLIGGIVGGVLGLLCIIGIIATAMIMIGRRNKNTAVQQSAPIAQPQSEPTPTGSTVSTLSTSIYSDVGDVRQLQSSL